MKKALLGLILVALLFLTDCQALQAMLREVQRQGGTYQPPQQQRCYTNCQWIMNQMYCTQTCY